MIRATTPAQFIALIGQLYAVEAKAREVELDTNGLLEQRQLHSVPVLQKIEALLLENLHAVLPGSLLGRALRYLSGQWSKLTLYVTHGAYPCHSGGRPERHQNYRSRCRNPRLTPVRASVKISGVTGHDPLEYPEEELFFKEIQKPSKKNGFSSKNRKEIWHSLSMVNMACGSQVFCR